MSEENLTGLLTEFEGYLTQIRRVKEKLGQESASVEQQNQLLWEKAIKGAPLIIETHNRPIERRRPPSSAAADWRR
jgi:hypothetical protein